jgi:excisionase family DNA binding protein
VPVCAWSQEEFLTVVEVAGRLKHNQQTIRNWKDDGTPPAVRIGSRVRVLRSDLQALLDGSAYRADAVGPASCANFSAQAFREKATRS